MLTKFKIIAFKRLRTNCELSQVSRFALALAFVGALLAVGARAQTPPATAQPTPPPQPQPLPTPQRPRAAQPNNNPNAPGQPLNPSAPGQLNPGAPTQQQPPPPANNAPVQQPQPGQTQTQPNAPPGLAPGTVQPIAPPNSAAPGSTAPAQPTTPAAAGQNIGTSGIAPAELPLPPPPIEPNFEAPNRPLPSAERIGVDVTEQTPLTLNEAVALALENNTDIEASRIDVRLSEFDLTAARGAFDPRIAGQSFYERARTPTASTLGSATGATNTTNFTGNFGLNGFTPIAGGSYQAQFNSSRQTTDAPFTSLNPQFPTAFNFSYTQPLWRGLRIDDNRRRIQIAKKNLSLTDAQFRQQSIDVILRTTQAYWDLAFALRNLQVQIDSVKQARVQVESNERQVALGTIAPIDLVAANTQVTNFEQNVYTAQEQVTRAEATLKTLLLPNKNAALWARALVPITPITFEAPRASFADSLEAAYANRPELDQLRTNQEINLINRRYFKDQTRPQIDLVGTFVSAGLAGSVVQTDGANPLTSSFGPIIDRVNVLSANANLPPIQLPPLTGGVLPGNLVGGYGQSLRNIIGLNYPTYQLGVNIDVPLGNRTAKANYGRSLAEGTRIETQRAQTEQQIKLEVQTSLQALASAQARLASAAASRASGEQLYGSEQRRYENGTSTIFLVLQRQQELVAARGSELRAQTDLNKAIGDFQKATGNTFQANKIDIGTETSRRLRITAPIGDDYTPAAVRSSLRRTITNSGKTEISALNEQP